MIQTISNYSIKRLLIQGISLINLPRPSNRKRNAICNIIEKVYLKIDVNITLL